jgi:hypothetical protein
VLQAAEGCATRAITVVRDDGTVVFPT